VGGLGNAVLLEGAVNGITGKEGFGTKRFVGSLAEVTGEAGTVDPLFGNN